MEKIVESVRPKNARPRSAVLRLTESGLMLAIAFVLCMFPLVELPYGGSITLGCMAPVIIIAYRYGVKWGLLTGLVFSLLQILQGGIKVLSSYGTTVAFFLLILFLDYIVAFVVLGLAGVFRGKLGSQRMELAAGALLACVLRYLCHFFSGITIWAGTSIPAVGAVPYSLVYNATYMLPETIIAVLAVYLLGSALDFRKDMVGPLTSQAKQSPLSTGIAVGINVILLGALAFDTAHIFSFLQNAETGEFDITGIANCNWVLVAIVTVAAIAIAVIGTLVRRSISHKAAAAEG